MGQSTALKAAELFKGFEWKTVLLLIASLVLSAASFYTTYHGMIEFMKVPLIAAAITFAVQALLFVICWWLARNWFLGPAQFIVGTSVFLMCAAISIFFSFASLFGFIDGGRTLENTASRAQTEVARILTNLQNALDEDYANAHDDMVRNEEGPFFRWQSELYTALDAASTAPEEFRRSRLQARNQIEGRLIDVEAELENKQRQLTTVTSSADSRDAQLTAVTNRISEQRNELRGQRQLVLEQEVQRDQAQQIMDAEAETGQGPNWRAARDRRNQAVQQLGFLESRIAALERSLEALDEELAGLSAPDDPERRPRLERDVRQLEAERADLQEALDEFNEETAVDLDDRVELIKARLQDFVIGQDFEALRGVVAECTAIIDTLKEFNIQAELPAGFNCAPQRLQFEIARLEDQFLVIKRYSDSCVGSQVFGENLGFGEIIEKGETCIALSNLAPDLTSDASEQLFAFRATGGDNAHGFALAQAALFRDHNPLAVLAVAIAIAIDSLVLLCAFIGTSTMVPVGPDIQRFLYLPRRTSRDPDMDGASEGLVDIPASGPERASFNRVSRWLLTHGYAVWAEHREPVQELGGVGAADAAPPTPALVLRPGALRALRKIIGAHDSGSGASEPGQAGGSRVPPKLRATGGRVRKIHG